ncbi:MAG TPA: glycosyltransferase family 39 protein [Acetobacteraceae bacterium]|nr:glycosyltransferase family 39 protein [Acetobacteraceae bacterium]
MELRGLGDAGLARALIFPGRSPRGLALAALVAVTLLRLAVAAAAPIAPDEAYYWVWSRALAAGYPDHPPMVALWCRLGTAVVGNSALGIRLVGSLAIAVASLLVVEAGNRLLSGRGTGLRAALLLNATLLFGVGGVLLTPDAPLLVFWCAALWSLARLVDSGDPRWWLVTGVCAGLALASKYTAALLWFGIAIWLMITPAGRQWLRRPAPWLGAILGSLVVLPVVLWEARHGWVSMARQGGRIGDWHAVEGLRFLGELLAGQIGLATPLVFLLCAAGVVMVARAAWLSKDSTSILLAALTLPGVVLFTEHALGARVQGNWPAVIYPAAALAAGGLRSSIWRRMVPFAVAIGLTMTGAIYLQATIRPFPLPVRLDPIARQLEGWDGLAARVVDRSIGADFIASDQYGLAAKLALTMQTGPRVVSVDGRWSTTDLPRTSIAGQVGLLINDAPMTGRPVNPAWSSITEAGLVARRLGDETIATYWLYRVTGAAGAEAVLMPRP